MRKWLVGLVAALVLLVGAVAVVAATGSGGGRLDRQTFRWTTSSAATSSTEWSSVPDLRGRTGCPGDPSTAATVSLELGPGSSPVDVRVTMDDPLSSCVDCEEVGTPMKPGAVRFGQTSSFTFVAGRAVGEHGTVFDVQWRIAAGGPPNATATLDSGTLHLLWDRLDAPCR